MDRGIQYIRQPFSSFSRMRERHSGHWGTIMIGIRRTITWMCTVALLAGCAAANQPAPPLPGTNQTARSPEAQARGTTASNRKHRRKGTLTVRIKIPRRDRHGTRGPRFIAAATKGMTMAFTGPTTMTQAVNLTPSDPRCTGTPLTCTIAVTLLAGNYTVTIDTYNKAPVGGSIPAGASLLSTAKNAAFTMVGGITNRIGVTLDGASHKGSSSAGCRAATSARTSRRRALP